MAFTLKINQRTYCYRYILYKKSGIIKLVLIHVKALYVNECKAMVSLFENSIFLKKTLLKGSSTNVGVPNVGVDKRRSVKTLI